MKTLIYSDGKVYHLGEMEPVQEGVPCLLSGGKGVWNPGKDDLLISRHRVTPVDPDDKHAVAMKVGKTLCDEIPKDQHLSYDPCCVTIPSGSVILGFEMLDDEPEVVEKTTEDHLRAVLEAFDVEDNYVNLARHINEANAHLDKMNDPSA